MGIWDIKEKAHYNFYKKLDESGNPTGNLFVYKNLKVLHKDVDFNDKDAVKELGYCYHLNTPIPIYLHGNYTKEWVNNGDKVVGDAADNVYDHDWQEVDKASELSEDELNERKALAWIDLRSNRDMMLKRTDWWELPSNAPMSAERTAYRQALRDLPATTTDPFDVTWPNNPDTPDDAKPFE